MLRKTNYSLTTNHADTLLLNTVYGKGPNITITTYRYHQKENTQAYRWEQRGLLGSRGESQES
jgi:hypothetical protein